MKQWLHAQDYARQIHLFLFFFIVHWDIFTVRRHFDLLRCYGNYQEEVRSSGFPLPKDGVPCHAHFNRSHWECRLHQTTGLGSRTESLERRELHPMCVHHWLYIYRRLQKCTVYLYRSAMQCVYVYYQDPTREAAHFRHR